MLEPTLKQKCPKLNQSPNKVFKTQESVISSLKSIHLRSCETVKYITSEAVVFGGLSVFQEGTLESLKSVKMIWAKEHGK